MIFKLRFSPAKEAANDQDSSGHIGDHRASCRQQPHSFTGSSAAGAKRVVERTLKALANKDTQFSAFTNEAQCNRPLASSPAFGHQLRLILRSAVRDFNVVQKPLGHITDLI